MDTISLESMTPSALTEQERKRVARCESRIGYRFKNPRLLLQALTHSSTIQGSGLNSNERLEFLGDSVLGLTISEFLYNFLDKCDEGELTRIKSATVSTNALAAESERLKLGNLYNVGKGVGKRNKLPNSLLANVFEAVIAAIYLEAGFEEAKRFILRNLFHTILAVCDNRHEKNYKSLLQQYTQKENGNTPSYKVVKELGPDHNKNFKVVAVINKKHHCSGSGKTKKEAEQEAARKTLSRLEQTFQENKEPAQKDK